MLYYKVLPEFDQKRLYKKVKNTIIYYDFLVSGELYTKKELEKLKNKNVFGYNYSMFIPVIISKNKTYIFFGARFSNV